MPTSKPTPKPFLKWPGGKRWIAYQIADIIRPELRARYYEPFLGAGAVFLSLRPSVAHLSDINRDLIECIRTAGRCPYAVAEILEEWSNCCEDYYRIRSRSGDSILLRAARLIYLTKTSWGGMYRVNKEGEFNVPFGDSGRSIYNRREFISAAKEFRRAEIRAADFEDAIAEAGDGDAIYADPPYTTLGQNNGFCRYNEKLFAWKDQERLAAACKAAAERGAFVIVSGLLHDSLLALYRDWHAIVLQRHSTISCQAEHRRNVKEVLLLSRRSVCAFINYYDFH